MNIKSLKIKQIKTLILFLFYCLLSCNNKQKEITKILTNDSIQYWNISVPEDKRPVYHNSYSFSKTGVCEKYNIDYNEIRNIIPRDTVPDKYGIYNKWNFINDSTINMGGFIMKIANYSRDSIVLKDKNNDSYSLYRVIGPFRVSPKSIRERDSLITIYAKERERDKGAFIVTDTIK
ncbi:hypothetical protein [Flavobacterium salmonis]|uniref:Uncharacterized protein n=1 Tax=Flavobacterium salmonis TaxID=2654844 RepID=A0A6V6YPR7_9FLAO|nr:hypothetical protein [Flavobacterium salmonis]CAD0001366.1 hypothetical protein FLAT13_00513 [Flavobacterium salmonis]